MIVTTIIGLINSLTISIKYLPNGCMATAVEGEKCPNSIPANMASNTQKVRFFCNFFTTVYSA
jgi:hypothetical protein